LPTPPDGASRLPAIPGAFAPPPAERQKAPAKRKKVLVSTGALVLVALVGSGGYLALQELTGSESADQASRSTSATAPTSEPVTSAVPDPAGTSVLNTETTDPQQLALAEAFPDKKVEIAGATFSRVKTELTDDCTAAAAGAFADALKQNKCSRILRATYVDGKKRYAVTTGIAVLPTRENAMQADKAKKLGDNVWFKPLPGKSGTGTERVHIAGGYASGLVWGRYVVFSYATNADGRTPTEKDKNLGKISGGFRDTTALVLERRITG
jgi:hypothetical protein